MFNKNKNLKTKIQNNSRRLKLWSNNNIFVKYKNFGLKIATFVENETFFV